MPRIVVVNSLTLDGVTQAPEDSRDGFAHGGRAVPYSDEVMGKAMGERMAAGGALLLGRRTYEDFHGYWPKQNANPYTEVLNNACKYVMSRTRRWVWSTSCRWTRTTCSTPSGPTCCTGSAAAAYEAALARTDNQAEQAFLRRARGALTLHARPSVR